MIGKRVTAAHVVRIIIPLVSGRVLAVHCTRKVVKPADDGDVCKTRVVFQDKMCVRPRSVYLMRLVFQCICNN